ncbi:hypothetical protein YC2023_091861 [Brassica napus]
MSEFFKEREYHDAVRHHTKALGPRGMQDPAIQNILADPVMRQENPPTAQEHMQTPMIMKKYKSISTHELS